MQLPEADNFCHVICLSRFINCINLLEEKNIMIKFVLVLVNINLFNCIPSIIRHGFYLKPMTNEIKLTTTSISQANKIEQYIQWQIVTLLTVYMLVFYLPFLTI